MNVRVSCTIKFLILHLLSLSGAYTTVWRFTFLFMLSAHLLSSIYLMYQQKLDLEVGGLPYESNPRKITLSIDLALTSLLSTYRYIDILSSSFLYVPITKCKVYFLPHTFIYSFQTRHVYHMSSHTSETRPDTDHPSIQK